MSQISSSDVIIFTIFGIATIALLFGFILYFVFGYRSKQRDNQLLLAQKEEINIQKSIIENTLSELKAAQKQLIQSEKLASLGEITAGIAHEIQNPLNFVNNFSELSNELIQDIKLEKEQPPEKRDDKLIDELFLDIAENLEKITTHGRRASDIVKSMLLHSRANSGHPEVTEINKLVDEYLRLAYHGLRAQDKSFNSVMNTDFDETIPPFQLMRQDIGRVILNIITNAFQAVNEKSKKVVDYKPEVTVKTKKIAETIEILITDNGLGIPKANLDKIFQPFFTTKPAGMGTGLGLSLAYDIVIAHNGNLSVETVESEGTTFKIILPIKN